MGAVAVMHICDESCPVPKPLHRGPMWPIQVSPCAPRLLDPEVVLAQDSNDKTWTGRMATWKR